MRIGVVTFPGSLDDVDAARAVRVAGGEPVALWHGDHDLKDVDAVVLPGGFSYGDYLRCGAISRFSPVMTDLDAATGWYVQSLSASVAAAGDSGRWGRVSISPVPALTTPVSPRLPLGRSFFGGAGLHSPLRVAEPRSSRAGWASR